MPRTPIPSALAGLVMCILLIACGGQASPTTTPFPTPTAEQILDQAADRFGELSAVHYQLIIDGDVFLDSGRALSLRGAEGDLARPNSATAKANIGFAGATITVNMIAVDGEQYMTNFLTGRWERAPEELTYNPAILFDPEQGIQGVMQRAERVTLVGEEQIGGATTDHLRGVVAQEAVQPITGGAFQGDPIDFDIWIDRSSNDIRRVVLHDTAAAEGTTPATWTLELTDQDKPVTITPPNN